MQVSGRPIVDIDNENNRIIQQRATLNTRKPVNGITRGHSSGKFYAVEQKSLASQNMDFDLHLRCFKQCEKVC